MPRTLSLRKRGFQLLLAGMGLSAAFIRMPVYGEEQKQFPASSGSSAESLPDMVTLSPGEKPQPLPIRPYLTNGIFLSKPTYDAMIELSPLLYSSIFREVMIDEFTERHIPISLDNLTSTVASFQNLDANDKRNFSRSLATRLSQRIPKPTLEHLHHIESQSKLLAILPGQFEMLVETWHRLLETAPGELEDLITATVSGLTRSFLKDTTELANSVPNLNMKMLDKSYHVILVHTHEELLKLTTSRDSNISTKAAQELINLNRFDLRAFQTVFGAGHFNSFDDLGFHYTFTKEQLDEFLTQAINKNLIKPDDPRLIEFLFKQITRPYDFARFRGLALLRRCKLKGKKAAQALIRQTGPGSSPAAKSATIEAFRAFQPEDDEALIVLMRHIRKIPRGEPPRLEGIHLLNDLKSTHPLFLVSWLEEILRDARQYVDYDYDRPLRKLLSRFPFGSQEAQILESVIQANSVTKPSLLANAIQIFAAKSDREAKANVSNPSCLARALQQLVPR